VQHKIVSAFALFLAFSSCERAKVTKTSTAASPSLPDIQAAITAAADGDTVVIPAGTGTWTAKLELKKGITLAGQTTVAGAGTKSPTINALTTIDGASAAVMIMINPGQSARITGLKFTGGGGDYTIRPSGKFSQPVKNIRIDHCYFDHMNSAKVISPAGWTYGVVDHCVFDFTDGYMFVGEEATYGAPTNCCGNGAWADFPWFGTDKFWFLEDNTFRMTGSGTHGLTDTVSGSRFVYRHNYSLNTYPQDHGTEGGTWRYDRCKEIYNNQFDFTQGPTNIGQRGGSSLMHDNSFTGTKHSGNVLSNINSLRAISGRSETIWGQADGTSVWDENDTDGQGHFVEGQAPHLFESGTCTTGNNTTMTDSTQSWTPNQWIGFSIQDTDSALPHLAGHITSNTATQITFTAYTASDTARHLVFAPGIHYAIHRVLRQLDTASAGRTDQIIVDATGHPINTTTGEASYPHYLYEPTFGWNNKHESGAEYKFKSANIPWIIEGRDFFNLGLGLPPPQQVVDAYPASINGVQYAGPFVYPHPLVSGGGVSPSPNPTPSPTASATSPPSATPRPPTPTPTSTPAPTATPAPTPTSTPAPSPTGTPPPTATPTAAPTAAPIAPSSLGANPGNPKRSITINWQNNGAYDSIEIERGDNANEFERVAAVPGNTSEFGDRDLVSGQEYYYRVRARNSIGVSDYSNTASAPAK
jgi:hypothetical protein